MRRKNILLAFAIILAVAAAFIAGWHLGTQNPEKDRQAQINRIQKEIEEEEEVLNKHRLVVEKITRQMKGEETFELPKEILEEMAKMTKEEKHKYSEVPMFKKRRESGLEAATSIAYKQYRKLDSLKIALKSIQ
jgi:uncharacterized protein HemX